MYVLILGLVGILVSNWNTVLTGYAREDGLLCPANREEFQTHSVPLHPCSRSRRVETGFHGSFPEIR